MSDLVGVIVVGMLTYVVVSILVGGLQNHMENDELKEKIGKLKREKNFYEEGLEKANKSLRNLHILHDNTVCSYKRAIRDLEQQLKEQSNPMDNRINWIREQIEQKSEVIDKHNKEYRELLDELRRARNQR